MFFPLWLAPCHDDVLCFHCERYTDNKNQNRIVESAPRIEVSYNRQAGMKVDFGGKCFHPLIFNQCQHLEYSQRVAQRSWWFRVNTATVISDLQQNEMKDMTNGLIDSESMTENVKSWYHFILSRSSTAHHSFTSLQAYIQISHYFPPSISTWWNSSLSDFVIFLNCRPRKTQNIFHFHESKTFHPSFSTLRHDRKIISDYSS